MEQNFNVNDLLSFSPMDLAKILNDTFIFDIPEQVETEQELNEVGKMLARTSNEYSFLISLLSFGPDDVADDDYGFGSVIVAELQDIQTMKREGYLPEYY